MAKISKREADYIYKAKKDHCKDCSMFRAPDKCTLVVSPISPDGSCRYFKAKNRLPVK